MKLGPAPGAQLELKRTWSKLDEAHRRWRMLDNVGVLFCDPIKRSVTKSISESYATPTGILNRTISPPKLQLTTFSEMNLLFGTMIAMLSFVFTVVLLAPIETTSPFTSSTSIQSPTLIGRSMRMMSPLMKLLAMF